ncbi:hypothetical protein M3212_09490 [Alkalihalobacillus oceani]|uniref:hypothetical protein n=1 Tax=Halalkalibacter oceani TaxID=1653776 RepID=UPI00203E04EB|nr:hypothetical protein [Halalkalibacter oceani]MCM3761016.1 hypothetical protein [Halalkalibacter oceani]
MKWTTLPSTVAESVDEIEIVIDDCVLSFTENRNEKLLYDELNKRLLELERSVDILQSKLEMIQSKAEEFQIAVEEKEEILLRIDWLHRLYEAKEQLEKVDTKEKAKQLRRSISGVQTCPLKKQLMNEIKTIEASLPSEKKSEPSMEEKTMERAIQHAGKDFINLGRAGREYVIQQVLANEGEKIEIEQIKQVTVQVEKQVETLKEVDDLSEMISQLMQLPLPLFPKFEADRQKAIAERLLESKLWNGLATLERMIKHLDRLLTKEQKEKEEEENTIVTDDGKAALVLNIENDEQASIVKVT